MVLTRPDPRLIGGVILPPLQHVLPSSPNSSPDAVVAEWGPRGKTAVQSSRRDTGVQVGEPVFWPHGEAYAVEVANGSDAPQRASVYVYTKQSKPPSSQRPTLELDVAAGGVRVASLDPNSGDTWAPWIIVQLQALSAPSQGECDVILIRVGGVA